MRARRRPRNIAYSTGGACNIACCPSHRIDVRRIGTSKKAARRRLRCQAFARARLHVGCSPVPGFRACCQGSGKHARKPFACVRYQHLPRLLPSVGFIAGRIGVMGFLGVLGLAASLGFIGFIAGVRSGCPWHGCNIILYYIILYI